MRNAFAKVVCAIAERDPSVVLLSGDIGNRLFDDFKTRCPGRFFNCGVAEANMMSMAAGMASCGLRPVVYTITPFLTYRCMEQIRDDVCYHNQRVVIVGTGSGLSYASLGTTHHSCEEMGMLRLLPGLSVLAPADAFEVEMTLSAALQHDGPAYIRIGKKGEPTIHSAAVPWKIGDAISLRDGTDVALLSTGTLLQESLDTADILRTRGLSLTVLSMPTVKPLNTSMLASVFSRHRLVATVEEHSILGGLGGSVAEWLCDQPRSIAGLIRIGTPDAFLHRNGEQEHAREILGLTPVAMADRIVARLASL
jgi:transketolase